MMLLPLLASASAEVPSEWYSGYCGRVARSIQPVAPADRDGYELAAVGVVTRHGARSPGRLAQCWEGYDPDGISWACDEPAESLVLDHLHFSLSYAGAPSALGARSRCAIGQLLDEGRAQQRALGHALRAAYVGPEATVDGLLPTELPRYGQTGLSLRSSSIERAIVSGQELVAGLVNGSASEGQSRALLWAVGEPETEWIYPNVQACPRLAELENDAIDAYASDSAIAASEARTRASLESAVGQGALETLRGNVALDCLMANVCQAAVDPGAALPAGLSTPLLADAWAAIEAFEAHLVAHGGAAWSKLAMARLGRELLQHSRAAVEQRLGRPKLALWSGHDTTVMPLMAALGVHDGHWAPYAANFVVETWRQAGSEGASGAPSAATSAAKSARFRLLYMGREVTARLPGCEDAGALCAYDRLEAALAPWSLSSSEWSARCAPTSAPAPRAALARLRAEGGSGAEPLRAREAALVALAAAVAGALATVALGAVLAMRRPSAAAALAARAAGAGRRECAPPSSTGGSTGELERRLLVAI